MNKEFHYWITGLIAEQAGFPAADCRTIAYSSQYTDDNNREVQLFDSEFDPLPSYVTHVSQTEDITAPKKEIMKIYPLFHFLPGDKNAASPRLDNKTHPLLTTPGSSYANKIMQYTLQNAVSRYQAKDKTCLYRIGIAAHCFVDTWAHQNFIGWYDDINGLPGVAFPNIGHFDAKHDPDLVNHIWQDNRLVHENINNNERFLAAAKMLYEQLRSFCEKVFTEPGGGSWNELETFLQGTCKLDTDARIKSYKTRSKVLKDYDDRRWESGAFNIQQVPVDGGLLEKCVWRADVKRTKTDWFNFQEAVKQHIVDASTILRPAFLEAGIDV